MKNQSVDKNHVFPVSDNQKDGQMEDPIKFKMNSNLAKLRGSIVVFALCKVISLDEARAILETNSISQEVARKILRYIEISKFGNKAPFLPSNQRSVSLSKYVCN